MHRVGDPGARLAEVVAALSLATDLGMGQPMEHALRSCLLALRLGEELGLSEAELTDLYYVALLRRIGCTSDAHALGRLFGDDLAAHARIFTVDVQQPLALIADMLRHAGRGKPIAGRLGAIATGLAAGPSFPRTLFRGSCEVAQGLAKELGFETAVRAALLQTFERWDGGGAWGQTGEAILLPARIAQLAEDAEVLQRLAGLDGMLAAVRRQAGAAYDPAIAKRFGQIAGRLFHDIETGSAWDTVLAVEPGPRPRLSPERLDSALRAIALFADLKSPFTATHSTGVADLAGAAATRAGLPAADVATVHRAALVHDLGRVGVPSGIWDKPGALSAGEWERVRLHPYYTERVLVRAPGLARLATVAGLHHERLDGSGYVRGAEAGALPATARILAAADVYHAVTEPRPHRPASSPEQAATELRREVRAGRLDGVAVDAVLRAAGHRVRRQREWPAQLSAREVEVLRLLARGLANREIAARLTVSEPTIATHLRHIYDKLGVTTRVAATLFAMQHGLLEPADPAETSSIQTMRDAPRHV